MKAFVYLVALIAAPALAAENSEPRRDAQIAEQAKQGMEHVIDDGRVVIITDAEFVPFPQFLGLPSVNTLPPTSAGNPKPAQHRMP